jgi:outer membrane lipoprotein-sorting protein
MRIALLVALVFCLWPTAGLSSTDAELLRLLERAERRYAQLQDYSAIMLSRERIGDVLEPEKRVLLKFQRPFRVYMKWLDGPGKGREGLYVDGAHNSKFLVYEPNGLLRRLFTAALEPGDPRVLEVSRHPVTDVGIGRILEIVGENVRRAVKSGTLRVVDRGVVELVGRKVREIEGILPKDPAAGYYGYRVTLCFDEEHALPIRAVVYDWQDRLVEDYIYSQLRLNPGFSFSDFDPANPGYGFSGWRIPVPG